MFNLKKAQLSSAPEDLESIVTETSEQVSGDGDVSSNQLTDNVTNPEAEEAVKNLIGINFFNNIMGQIRQSHPNVASAIEAMPDYKQLAVAVNGANPNILEQQAAKFKQEGVVPTALNAQDMKVLENRLMDRVQSLSRQMEENKQLQEQNFNMQFAAFNLKKAQISSLHNTEDMVSAENTFVERYLRPLLSFDGQKKNNDAISMQARNEILDSVSPIAQEEVESIIESIQSTIENEGQAADELRRTYRNYIAPNTQEVNTMANTKTDGIIKFNLSDHVLNNKMVKEAADHFGQYSLLYGPTEKRICPKLRGKGGGYSGAGDVVSEYICRHHCLDGIVIDDNKTVCGEALWRANAMDKQSREYVDKDGTPTGGYIEKRFEVNHNVPDENKMRLKPGETRKPRPAATHGNYEARMQAMRQSEGEQRDYRPNTNDGDPFNWCTDVDQNNVEVPQSTRDQREEASGHKTVQYSNKDNLENIPAQKIGSSFNLKTHKVAQGSNIPITDEGRPFDELIPSKKYRKDKSDKKAQLSPTTYAPTTEFGALTIGELRGRIIDTEVNHELAKMNPSVILESIWGSLTPYTKQKITEALHEPNHQSSDQNIANVDPAEPTTNEAIEPMAFNMNSHKNADNNIESKKKR